MDPADGRRWLEEHAGFNEAQMRIAREARLLRVDPTNPAAIRHALATFEHETGKSPRIYNDPLTPPTQEGLIP